MNWEAIGAIGEVAGAAGVIITLVYLAVQIRQNTRSLQAAAIDANHDHFIRSQLVYVQDPELADLMDRGAADYAGLDRPEKRRFRADFLVMVKGMEVEFSKHRLRLLPRSGWEAYEATLAHTFGRPGWRQCWNETKLSVSPEFRELVEEVIESRLESGPSR